MHKFWSKLKPFILAACMTLLALVAQKVVQTHTGNLPFLLVHPTVILISWFFGFWPGVLSIYLSAVGANLFFMEPKLTIWVEHPADFWRITAFCGTSFLIAWCFAREKRNSTDAKEAMQRSEVQLSFVADRLPAFVSYTDAKGRYRFVNRTYCEWFGRPRDHILGSTRQSLVSGDKEALVSLSPHELKALAGEEVAFELKLQKQTGELKILNTEYLPDIDPRTKKVRGFIAVGHDVTQFVKVREEMENAIRTRDEFLSIASHELNTPLTSLKLQLQLSKRNLGPEDQEIAKKVDSCLSQTNRLVALVDDLLDVSRMQAGKLNYDFKEIDLTEVVVTAANRLAEQFARAGYEFTTELDSGMIIRGDAFRIDQVVTNLLTNALKYGMRKPVSVELHKVGSRVLLSVKDEGEGIPVEKQGLIFERFERAVNSKNISGLGLGLYISHEIMLAHGGEIEVKSDLGKGSVFTAVFPAV